MKNNKYFKYVVVIAVLLIPFMYSFFYLKAYWNPYGKGNIDNIPVAIINNDEGENGDSLVNSIKDSGKLKIDVVDENVGMDGLYAGDYYAVINIPADFTSNMESASSNTKKHATITYSPNQKANYLSSQIINNVVNVVEKNLDNKVNSKIVSSLSDSISDVPNSLGTISNGFGELNDGTNKLRNGSKALNTGIGTLSNSYESFDNGIDKIKDGTSSLKGNYDKFNSGVKTVKDGIENLSSSYSEFDSGIKSVSDGVSKLDSASSEFETLSDNIDDLVSGVSSIKNGSDEINGNLNNYVDGVNNTLGYTQSLVDLINATICPKVESGIASGYESQMCAIASGLSNESEKTGNTTVINYLTTSGEKLKEGNTVLNQGVTSLNEKVSNLGSLKGKLTEFRMGISSLKEGTDTLSLASDKIKNGITNLETGSNNLYSSSLQVVDGIGNLNDGVLTLADSSKKVSSGINSISEGSGSLYSGIVTLDNSVKDAKEELDNNIETTKNDVSKVSDLEDYSLNPVEVLTKEVNKVSSYGTAFSPLFISIALWVGSLMMYIVLYYDKEERFGILCIGKKNRVKRLLCYHGLATISAILLGVLLQLLLDFNITNIFLYYLSIILISNCFMGIIGFLIGNFGDVGKFVALVVLVLQLAAAGGTFPIETVTHGFRFLNPLLPMTYTVNLLKESLISIDSSLLTKNLIIVIVISFAFIAINIFVEYKKEKKEV